MHCFSTVARGTALPLPCGSSVFQSPEGDSLFFYVAIILAIGIDAIGEFQSPEGDSLFFYTRFPTQRPSRTSCFSPPKGIHCFSTISEALRTIPYYKFQSPEGDSGLCYLEGTLKVALDRRVSVPRRGFRSLLLARRG